MVAFSRSGCNVRENHNKLRPNNNLNPIQVGGGLSGGLSVMGNVVGDVANEVYEGVKDLHTDAMVMTITIKELQLVHAADSNPYPKPDPGDGAGGQGGAARPVCVT